MTEEFIHAGGDPQVGNLATPLNSSPVAKAFLNALPAYRAGLSANRRGLEVGMAHGYFLYGPFALFGPLRNTEIAEIAGLLAAVGLVSILTIALSLYASAGSDVSPPEPTVTTPNPPAEWATKEGWNEFGSGFFLGGCGGAIFAWLLCTTPHLLPLVDLASDRLAGAPIPL